MGTKTDQDGEKVTVSNSNKKEKKYLVKTKKTSKKGVASEVEIGKRAVDSAKAGTGAYKARKWTSKLHYDKNGAAYARTDKEGGKKKVSKATTPIESKSMEKKYKYDRKVFVKDSTDHANMRKRTAAGKPKGTK